MIGKLKGRVDAISADSLIIDVGGVGYEVFCSARTLAALPSPGEAVTLVIETHVREDHIHLYGFADAAEREWFRTLTQVQRVGNRMAISILGVLAPSQIATAITARDTTAFSRISGIGPKLAERIVTELKDKVAALPASEMTFVSVARGKGAKSAAEPSIAEDAVSALLHLGYTRSDAYSAAQNALREAGNNAPLDKVITLSLKELAR